MLFQLGFGSDDIPLEQGNVFDNLEPLANGIQMPNQTFSVGCLRPI